MRTTVDEACWWDRTTYRLLMNTDSPTTSMEVDGITIPATPWIGLHLSETNHIAVTHIASGKHIASFPSLGAAFRFANRIRNLADWALAEPLMTESLCREITALRIELGHTAFLPRRV